MWVDPLEVGNTPYSRAKMVDLDSLGVTSDHRPKGCVDIAPRSLGSSSLLDRLISRRLFPPRFSTASYWTRIRRRRYRGSIFQRRATRRSACLFETAGTAFPRSIFVFAS